MRKQIIKTEKAPAAIGPYSQAVKAGKFIFVSGQIPLDPTSGQIVGGSIREQTTRVFQNIEQVLLAGGSKLDNVVKATVYLRDMNDFAAMNEVYEQFFGSSKPARATVQVARLPKDVGIEIDAVAVD